MDGELEQKVVAVLTGENNAEVRFTDPKELQTKNGKTLTCDHRFLVPIGYIFNVPVYGPFHFRDGSRYCTLWNPPDSGGSKVPLPRQNILDAYRKKHACT